MMSPLKKTCGLRMTMAMQDGTLHPVITVTMAALAVTPLHHAILMSQGPQGHLRDTQKTHQLDMTLQEDLLPQVDVENQGQGATILPTTCGIHLGTIMDRGPPGRETHTDPHAANLNNPQTCRFNHQVNGDHHTADRGGKGHKCVKCEKIHPVTTNPRQPQLLGGTDHIKNLLISWLFSTVLVKDKKCSVHFENLLVMALHYIIKNIKKK